MRTLVKASVVLFVASSVVFGGTLMKWRSDIADVDRAAKVHSLVQQFMPKSLERGEITAEEAAETMAKPAPEPLNPTPYYWAFGFCAAGFLASFYLLGVAAATRRHEPI